MYSHTNSEITWLIYDFLLLFFTGYMFTVLFFKIKLANVGIIKCCSQFTDNTANKD